ncbi:MAG: hypothetical protein HC800_20555 [Phormidesmis sp. RL_2_1]|nr:hypothetical protein [Phormidesmis sp. RL_2_1]
MLPVIVPSVIVLSVIVPSVIVLPVDVLGPNPADCFDGGVFGVVILIFG